MAKIEEMPLSDVLYDLALIKPWLRHGAVSQIAEMVGVQSAYVSRVLSGGPVAKHSENVSAIHAAAMHLLLNEFGTLTRRQREMQKILVKYGYVPEAVSSILKSERV